MRLLFFLKRLWLGGASKLGRYIATVPPPKTHQLKHVPVNLHVRELPTGPLGPAGVVDHDVKLENKFKNYFNSLKARTGFRTDGQIFFSCNLQL